MRSKLRYNDRGTPIITRQLANDVRKMCEMVGVPETQKLYGLDYEVLGKILTKKFPPKSRSISTKDIQEAKKTIQKVDKLARGLGFVSKTPSMRRASSQGSAGINIIQIKN